MGPLLSAQCRRHEQGFQAKPAMSHVNRVCSAGMHIRIGGVNGMLSNQSSCYLKMEDARLAPRSRPAVKWLLLATMRGAPADAATSCRGIGGKGWKQLGALRVSGVQPRAHLSSRTGTLDPSEMLPVSDRGRRPLGAQKTSPTISPTLKTLVFRC